MLTFKRPGDPAEAITDALAYLAEADRIMREMLVNTAGPIFEDSGQSFGLTDTEATEYARHLREMAMGLLAFARHTQSRENVERARMSPWMNR
jgi:hypothetical protein